jgi:hypothetical protein
MPEQIKKQRSFSSAYSSMLVDFLLSPKGPPSCWRAKPVIKAKLSVYRATEHNIYSKIFCDDGHPQGTSHTIISYYQYKQAALSCQALFRA